MTHIHFDNKELAFVLEIWTCDRNSIFHENNIINCLPESRWKNEIPSAV